MNCGIDGSQWISGKKYASNCPQNCAEVYPSGCIRALGCIDFSEQLFLPITTTHIENIGTVDDTDPRIRPMADIKLKIITVHRDVNRLLNAPATGPEG